MRGKAHESSQMIELGGPTVCVAMPILNEEEVVENVIEEWLAVIRLLPDGSHILFEDGGSRDTTVSLIEQHDEYNHLIFLRKKSRPEGFGVAAKSLMASFDADYFFFTDSDGQYVASDFWKLWPHVENYHVARGVKLGRKDPIGRRIQSFFWNKFVRFLFEVNLSDINSAFFIIHKNALEQILPKLKHLPTMVVSELMLRCVLENLELKNVYIRHRSRENGLSRGIPLFKTPVIVLRQIHGLLLLKAELRIREDIHLG